MENLIFLPHNVPSLKNSKVKTQRGIFSSKTVTNYLRTYGIKSFSSSKKTVEEYKTKPNTFKKYFEDVKIKNYPVWVYFHFVRDSKRKFDFNNATQILLDLMTAHGIIEDDNMDYVLPAVFIYEGNTYSVNKENPGVFIQFKEFNSNNQINNQINNESKIK